MMTELNFNQINDYHLLASVFVIPTEFGGRKQPILNNYRGQFFGISMMLIARTGMQDIGLKTVKLNLMNLGRVKLNLAQLF